MQPFTTLTATAAPFAEDNVDTDIILPARFLLHTEKSGLGRFAFYERRQELDFVLDQPRFADAQILVAGANFGCGSSREQAPWALADMRYRAIVAPSFGEIFASNCAKNGMLCVALADTAPLMAAAEMGTAITIDLAAETVATGNHVVPFTIDPGTREALLNGWGEVETILGRHGPAIHDFERRQRAAQPWLWSNG